MRELVYTAEKYGQTAAALRGLDSGRMTVGVSCDTYYRWLASAIAGFSRLHPAIRINTVYDVLSSRIIEMLNEHSVDLCIISRRDGAVGWTQIKRDELVAIVHCGDPLSKLDRIPLELLEKEPENLNGLVTCATADAKLYIPMGQLVDIAKEQERISKELDKARKNLASLNGKLSNENFTSRAPEAVVNAEREKAKKAADLIAALEESLAALKAL